MIEKRGASMLIDRGDILSALLASFLQGGDKPTLMALSVAFGIEKAFLTEIRRLKNERVITLTNN